MLWQLGNLEGKDYFLAKYKFAKLSQEVEELIITEVRKTIEDLPSKGQMVLTQDRAINGKSQNNNDEQKKVHIFLRDVFFIKR